MQAKTATAQLVWDHGLELYGAIWKHAPSKLIAIYAEASQTLEAVFERGAIEAWRPRKAGETSLLESHLPADAHAWSTDELMHRGSTLSPIWRRMTAHLHDGLKTGVFVAAGRVGWRGMGGHIDVVPGGVWDGDVDWRKGTVEREEFQFRAVQVLAKAEIEQFRKDAGGVLPRPSHVPDRELSSELVRKVFRELEEAGEIVRGSHRGNFQPIRDRLREEHWRLGFNGLNPSDEWIRRATLDLYAPYKA